MSHGLNIHLYPSAFVNESRILKITKALADAGHFDHITMIGVTSEGLPDVEAIDAQRTIQRLRRTDNNESLPSKIVGTLRWYLAVWKFLRGKPVACINVHSLPVLLLGVLLKWRHKAVLVYDTHELETETTESRGIRKILARFTERLLIRFADATFCVGTIIGEWYAKTYRMKQPYVVRNIPDVPASVTPANPSLRERLSIPVTDTIFLYLGGLAPMRGIERMLHLFEQAGAPSHLVMVGDGTLVPQIRHIAARTANIHHLPSVPVEEVVGLATGADVGISVISDACLSYILALPNKFFEYLHAGLPVLIGRAPEQERFVDKHDIGWKLSLDDEAALALIRNIPPAEIATKKANAQAVRNHYSWSGERDVLLAAYRELLA